MRFAHLTLIACRLELIYTCFIRESVKYLFFIPKENNFLLTHCYFRCYDNETDGCAPSVFLSSFNKHSHQQRTRQNNQKAILLNTLDFISTKDATFSIMQDIIFAPITRDAAVHPLNETRESDSNRLIDGSQSKETNIDRQKFILLFSNIVSRISYLEYRLLLHMHTKIS